MKLSNELFDMLKWIALNALPALEVLVLTIGKIWGLPYYAEIGASIAAFAVFLSTLLGISSRNYYKQIGEAAAGEEGADQSEEVL